MFAAIVTTTALIMICGISWHNQPAKGQAMESRREPQRRNQAVAQVDKYGHADKVGGQIHHQDGPDAIAELKEHHRTKATNDPGQNAHAVYQIEPLKRTGHR